MYLIRNFFSSLRKFATRLMLCSGLLLLLLTAVLAFLFAQGLSDPYIVNELFGGSVRDPFLLLTAASLRVSPPFYIAVSSLLTFYVLFTCPRLRYDSRLLRWLAYFALSLWYVLLLLTLQASLVDHGKSFPLFAALLVFFLVLRRSVRSPLVAMAFPLLLMPLLLGLFPEFLGLWVPVIPLLQFCLLFWLTLLLFAIHLSIIIPYRLLMRAFSGGSRQDTSQTPLDMLADIFVAPTERKRPYWNKLLCATAPQRVSAVLYAPNGTVLELLPAGADTWTLVREGKAVGEVRQTGNDLWQISGAEGVISNARRQPNGEWIFTDPREQEVAWIYDKAPLEGPQPKRRTITIWCADGGTAGLYLLRDTHAPLFPQRA